jgi:hypothetical protein
MTSTKAFSEGDEGTWKLLASSRPTEDLGDRLTSLSIRLEEDGAAPDHFWENLTTKLESRGFRYSASSLGKLSNNNATITTSPAAFESEAGKHHLEAVAALLQISQNRALQVTLDALKSIDSEGKHFQALLGSRDLLWKTLLYQQKQRLARLGVVAESLRLEQDPDAPSGRHAKAFLDALDSLYHDEGRHRGLFRRLLTIACAPTLVTTRDQLQPARVLRANAHMRLPPEREWNSFCGSIAEELRMQQMRERKEALEALLVLLYDRIREGVRRADYAALLIAFESQDFYAPASGPTELVSRITHLTGLICAECTALWRALTTSSAWISEHPLLLGILDQEAAKNEMEIIRALVSDSVQKSLGQNRGVTPGALGVLALGLLLQLAHQALITWNTTGGDQTILATFNTSALEMVQLANDRCGAYEFLYSIVDNLTRTPAFEQCSAAHDFLYDWQLNNKKQELLLENGTETHDSASDTTAYTSIAREVLAASIAAYGDSVLDIDNANSFENIGMLCSLGAKIFQSNPLLCQQFWADWEVYSNDSSAIYPMCRLLDASYSMTTAAFQVIGEYKISKELFLQAVAPFFHLLSSICHNSQMVENIMATFPSGLLRQALLCCRLPLSNHGQPSPEFRKSRLNLLTATARLAQLGNSASCLVQFRASLEESANMGDGPRVLTRLITGDDRDMETIDPVLTIMAHLLDGAPKHWAMQLAREIMDSQGSQGVGLSSCFTMGEAAVYAASLVLIELIEHLTVVVFCDAMDIKETIAFLHGLESSVLAAAGTLATSLTSTTPSDSTLSFGTVRNILQSLSNLLKVIRTVIQLPKSSEVRAAGLRVRDSIIETLGSSTCLGQAIMYYATAPVSLTLAIKLQGVIEDKSILQQVSGDGDYNPDDARKYGAWHSYVSHSGGGAPPLQQIARRFLVEAASKLSCDDIDLDGVAGRGWTGKQHWKTPLDAAFSALRLVSQWASHIDDIVSTHLDDLHSEPRPLRGKAKEIVEAFSPFRLLSSLATVPLPCREGSEMVSIWNSAGLSNLELLLPYLSGATQIDARYLDLIPSSTLLDLLNSCVGHIACTTPRDMAADTIFFQALYRSPRFSNAISDSIERAMSLCASQETYVRDEKAPLLDGILSLRVLASCVGLHPTIARVALYPGGNSIISKLVALASEVKVFTLSNTNTLFSNESEVTKIRLATGALAVLSSLWQSSRTSGPPNEKDTAIISSAIDECSSFITELTVVVSSYAQSKTLEDRLAAPDAADYAHVSLVTYIALALQILATEAAHQSRGDNVPNSDLVGFLLRGSISSSRFVDFAGYRRLSSLSVHLGNLGNGASIHPLRVLACFPSTSSTCLPEDFFSIGNTFDISAASHFLEKHAAVDGNSHDVVVKLSTSHHLANANLQVMEAWKRFSETVILFSSNLENGAANSERIFEFIDDTVIALGANLVAVNDAQSECSDLLPTASLRMASLLGELLLFFLDVGTRYCSSMASLPRAFRMMVLEKIATIGELVLSATSLGSKVDDIDHPSLSLGTTVLACAMVALDFVDPDEFASTETSRVHGVCHALCRTNCKVLPIARQSLSVNGDDECSHRSFLCCVSLLTLIISRNEGPHVDDAIYLKAASGIVTEFTVNALGEVLAQGVASASVAADELENGGNLSHRARMHMTTLQGILDLLFAIAEKGSPGLLRTLPEPIIAQLLVRNPLFLAQSARKGRARPRGYLVSDPTLANAASAFHFGEDDPVHAIWRTSLRVLTALIGSSKADDDAQFSAMTYELLEVYQHELVFALESCGSRLTCNGVKEATDILGMIAEMCTSHNRDHSQQKLGSLFSEYVLKAGFVVAVLSKFLGASGTARELFLGVDQYTFDRENVENGRKPTVQVWHPLIAEGIPSAKHEAVKFAHYASKRRQAVTATDFQESSEPSDNFILAANGSDSENDLERSSKMAVTNTFAYRMEQQVASCIRQALSILWRMHPASFSFRSLSEVETNRIDLMALVPTSSIIGFRPFEGAALVSMEPPLSFGRVVAIDTMTRTWQVRLLTRSVDMVTPCSQGHIATVRACQLACFEDLSFRKAATTYCPAPDPMSDLESTGSKVSLGSLVLILRWCHQESLFSESGEPITSAATIRLAEQACALLGAELSIHHENGGCMRATVQEKSKLDAQIFELLADIGDIGDAGQCEDTSLASFQDGRLKAVISPSAWQAIRPQVVDEVRRCWKERQEKERRGNERQPFGGGSSFRYSGGYSSGRGGASQKSAFRGSR